jgi:hypothetical protein
MLPAQQENPSSAAVLQTPCTMKECGLLVLKSSDLRVAAAYESSMGNMGYVVVQLPAWYGACMAQPQASYLRSFRRLFSSHTF